MATDQKAFGGANNDYYNQGQQQSYPMQYQAPPQNYPMQYQPPQQAVPQQPYNGGYDNPNPPKYGYSNAQAPPPQGEKQDFNQAFTIKGPKWHDLWASVLFTAVFLGYVAVSGIAIHGYATTRGFTNNGGIYGGNNNFGLSTNTIILFAFVLVVALVLGYGYLLMARAFTKQFIWITGILQIVFGFGTAVLYFVRKNYPAAIVFLLFAVFSVICFISWIKRIPFAVVMLQVTIDVAKNFGHIFLTSFIGGMIGLAYAAWFSVTLVAVYVKYEPGNNPACNNNGSLAGCSSAKVIGLLVFITFAGFWTSEIIKNVMHVTVSGVYGSWYFCSQKPGGFPRGATRGAFKRSMTYSFGSISFGSLIASLVQLLKQAVSIAQRTEAGQGNIVGSILFCILGCLVGLVDWAVQFINHYAFSHIALYGKAYIPAAKDTWRMMKDRGIDALVNDCLIDPVLTMGATFVAYVCTLLAYLFLEFTKPAYNTGGKYTAVIMAYAFLIGLQTANIFLVPIKSGVGTIFVAAAWDPQVLMTDFPDLYSNLVRVYPHIQTAIHA